MYPSYKLSDKLERSQKQVIRLVFQITGAKGVANTLNAPAVYGYDSISQASIDALLGTSTEVDTTVAFSATALGTDSFGFVVECAGQVKKVVAVEARCQGASSAGLAAAGVGSAALTSALTTTAAATTNGHVAGRVVVTGLDALTAGVLYIDIHVENK